MGTKESINVGARASDTAWWPIMNDDDIKLCQSTQSVNRRELLICSPLPQYAWEKVGFDLFNWNSKKFIV